MDKVRELAKKLGSVNRDIPTKAIEGLTPTKSVTKPKRTVKKKTSKVETNST